MFVIKFSKTLLTIVLLSAVSLAARAQIPVTDVGAIAQLVAEVNTLAQDLNTARQDLAQAQQQYQSMTGSTWDATAVLRYGAQLSADQLGAAAGGIAGMPEARTLWAPTLARP